jgi:carbamoyltransferase
LNDAAILGINAYHGDAAAALLRQGEVVSAVEEERFRRVKHWAGFPQASIRSCLTLGGIAPAEITHFAISRAPRTHLWRKVAFALQKRMRFGHLVNRVNNLRRVGDLAHTLADTFGLDSIRVRRQIHWVEHHPAHLASAYYASPFDEAAVCAIDGFGDFVSTSWALGRDLRLKMLQRVHFPHSLGLMYLALTQYLGFSKYGDEYKVMGLAPYGEPDYVEQLRQLICLRPDGGFALDLSYFRHHAEGVNMTWDEGEPTLGPVYTPKLETFLGPARAPDAPLEARHEAIAASLQAVYEEVAFHVLNHAYRMTRTPRLCLAGGCGMNSVANGKIRERTPFREVFIQPAAGDNGTALGAAFYVAHHTLGQSRALAMAHAYLGPAFDDAEIAKVIGVRAIDVQRIGCKITLVDDEDDLCRRTAEQIAEGQIVGWFQGRMEWGARALGNRSILADPRRADIRDTINAKIKFREKFRPFAPSILEESLDEYFHGAVADPFMVQVYPVRSDKRRLIPAVTHVDGSGRLQTVSRKTNPLYWRLIKEFEKRTGVPVLLNTSFNENEPIVHRPEEALDCFLRTRMDVLVMGHYVLDKCPGTVT